VRTEAGTRISRAEAGILATNLRRLIFFHENSAREAARRLGVNEHAISAWIRGKREPGAQALRAIDHQYGISPRDLDLGEVEFAQRLADPERMAYARRRRPVEGKLRTLEKAIAIRDERVRRRRLGEAEAGARQPTEKKK